MEEGQLKQDFFITKDGFINIKLKVNTEDKVEREKIVADLMSRLHNGDGFELSKNVGVEQIYFSNFDHNSNIKSIKEQILTDIESYFNDIIQ